MKLSKGEFLAQFLSFCPALLFCNLFSLKENFFYLRFFSSDCLLCMYLIGVVLSAMWLDFSFSESTNFCKVSAWAAHIALWVVYVNNNNKKNKNLKLPPCSQWYPTDLFSAWKGFIYGWFFPSHWHFSAHCASSSDSLTLSWLKN